MCCNLLLFDSRALFELLRWCNNWPIFVLNRDINTLIFVSFLFIFFHLHSFLCDFVPFSKINDIVHFLYWFNCVCININQHNQSISSLIISPLPFAHTAYFVKTTHSNNSKSACCVRNNLSTTLIRNPTLIPQTLPQRF